MTKENSKAVLAAGLLFFLGSMTAKAAEPFLLNSLSAAELSKFQISVPQPALPRADAGARSLPALAAQDDSLAGALTPAQWDELFSAGPETGAPGQSVTKELFSDFASRYVMNGTLQFNRSPKTFTTLEGKVYKVVKHPKWLKNPGSAELCVEGYIKQQDNTDELSIATVLPLNAADAYKPSAATKAVQRQPYILSKDSRGYTLANVNWGVQHDARGNRLKRADGIFKFDWPKGVTVRPEFLEQAYVGKKSYQGFPYAGAHGFLAFKFRPGGVTDEKGRSVRGLVISLNTYSLVPGVQNQGILDGLRGKYAVHYNINSAEGYVEANVFTDGNHISLYPLTLSRDRQVKLLENAIRQATANRTGEMYSLVYNSCTNAVVSFVNGVLSKDEKIKEGWLPELVYRLRATIPDAATALLTKRGLLAKPLPYLDENNYTQLFQE
ncbi:MAG TPA: hypothetical protein DCZ93_05190 [Elusimicrobia bacterium]|nr:MAG: hypothetical protein A2X35_07370 [Elusimicrobia bacterium GWA2_61_42]OGR75032.1 MAG: hypothetical protein A2X38_01520 [Elusimicrobia bacterium GWC2_61_25]HBB66687.1 hypothetical protein [Elusimicrobiota bacterium]